MITELKKKIRTHEYFIKGDERYFSEKDVKIAILEYRNILEHLDSQEILKEYDLYKEYSRLEFDNYRACKEGMIK